jgi:hypothetical protein
MGDYIHLLPYIILYKIGHCDQIFKTSVWLVGKTSFSKIYIMVGNWTDTDTDTDFISHINDLWCHTSTTKDFVHIHMGGWPGKYKYLTSWSTLQQNIVTHKWRTKQHKKHMTENRHRTNIVYNQYINSMWHFLDLLGSILVYKYHRVINT